MGTILAALSLLLLLPLIFRQYLTFAHTHTFFLLSGRNISHPLQKKIGTVAQSAQQLPDTIPAPVPASDTLPSAAASISGLSLLRLLRLKPSLCFALKVSPQCVYYQQIIACVTIWYWLNPVAADLQLTSHSRPSSLVSFSIYKAHTHTVHSRRQFTLTALTPAIIVG